MKPSKGWFKIVILIFAMGFIFAMGCAKKQSVTEEISEDERPAKERGLSSEAISEEELAAKRKADREAMLKTAAAQKFVNEDVYFDFDDASIRPDAREILNTKVEWLKANPGVSVIIEGHCDERGTEAYNIALGERRAQNIKSFLVTAGIDGGRLDTISYGEEKPLRLGNNEGDWEKNRRGHFRLN
jgi:peptidoglycan-associated lipoprotein